MKTIIRKVLLTIVCFASFLALFGCGEKVELSFDKTSYEATVGESITLNPTLTGTKELITYSFDVEGIVEISGNKVSCVKEGKVVVTASVKGAAEVKITINDLLEVDGECFDKIQKL